MRSGVRSKALDNAIVNSLSPAEIDKILSTIFTRLYVRGKQGRRSAEKSKLPYAVPYCIEYGGQLWANPYAFSCTKTFPNGYPCIPWKLNPTTVVHTLASASTKSSWVPRIPIHGVLWRYYNNYERISDQVSHVTDQALLISPHLLSMEPGEVNRARVACRTQRWYQMERSGTSRCPHWENPCQAPFKEPSLEWFSKADQQPIGSIPRRNKYAL